MSAKANQAAFEPWMKTVCRDVVVADEHAPPNVASIDLSTDDGKFKAVFGANGFGQLTNITYNFFAGPNDNGGNTNQRRKVEETVKEWELYANLTFVKVDDGQPAQIRVCFDPEEGSYSYVGTQCLRIPLDEKTMNLGWIEEGEETTAEDRGVILHEFGHALGMLHEHQSPNRDAAIQFNKENLYKIFSRYPNYWDKATVDQQILNVYSRRAVSNFSEFSSTSIMEYNFGPELIVGGKEIPRNQKLNDLDQAYMALNYPKIGDSSCDLQKYLKIVGMNDREIEKKILQAKDAASIRFWYSTWSIDKQAATANYGTLNV